jgi:hypothetical protein
VEINPVDDTLDIMRRHGFELRSEPSQLTLFSNQPEKDIYTHLAYIEQVRGISSFDFTLRIKTERFYCYTQLPSEGTQRFSSSSEGNLVEEDQIHLIAQHEAHSAFCSMQVSVAFDDLIKTPVEFMVKLNARKTRREYYVVHSGGVDIEHIVIEGNGIFKKQASITLATGQLATPFIMEGDPVPLKQKDDLQFQLIETAAAESDEAPKRKRTLFKVLPQPDPCLLSRIEGEGKVQFASPVYVYI